VDETRSADGFPPAPDETPAKRTRDTRALSTHLTPGESREQPEVPDREIPGYEILGVLVVGSANSSLYAARGWPV
jgi:hypothetical protein